MRQFTPLLLRLMPFIALCNLSPIAEAEDAAAPSWLVASGRGIHQLAADGSALALWTGGEARSLLAAGTSHYALTSKGILEQTEDGWVERNDGLPTKVIKKIQGGTKAFVKEVADLKDLTADPFNPSILVTGTKDAIFLSKDGGRSWKSLGFPARTNGLKAVAVVSKPSTIVFAAHSIYGVHYLECDKAGAKWTEMNTGLARLETTRNPDEVADLAVTRRGDDWTLWASQTFKSRIYRLDWDKKSFAPLWVGAGEFGTVESLDPSPGAIRFVSPGGVFELSIPGEGQEARPPRALDAVRIAAKTATEAIGVNPFALLETGASSSPGLSELYLLAPENQWLSSRAAAAADKTGIYLPVNHATQARTLAPYLQLIEQRGLNMVVVDMKDDYGRLRFTPKDQSLAEKGRVFNPVDLDSFIPTMKGKGIWLVARIVVFKDPQLAKWDEGRYAVWDPSTNAPWKGYRTVRRLKEPEAQGASEESHKQEYETVRNYYDETWVDPYSEEVWDYVVGLARELHERGFDEIQFDYIRFPTDGENLADARYRWRDPGMDMESAILSFLSFARDRIDAPISIDIYGANGWYRTGARTGQEVDLLSHFVDVICPMYYPSHFEQEFLAEKPAERRPYRIYYRGTLRTSTIARGRVLVRPYAQAFYLNVSYDKAYYGKDYVRQQAEGVRDAGRSGLTYWNNVGRYDEVPKADDLPASSAAVPLSSTQEKTN